MPLHLIPKKIAELISGRCRSIYRITAKKTYRNTYTLVFETSPKRRGKVQASVPASPEEP